MFKGKNSRSFAAALGWVIVTALISTIILGCCVPPDNTSTSVNNENTLQGLSSEQRRVVELFGWPQSFSIVELEDHDGKPVNLETWTYYDGQTTYIFTDGILQNWEEVDSYPSDLITSPYKPNQFSMGASYDETRALVPDSDWVKFPGADVFSEIGYGEIEIYATTQLFVGFHEGKLVFVEAIALFPDGA